MKITIVRDQKTVGTADSLAALKTLVAAGRVFGSDLVLSPAGAWQSVGDVIATADKPPVSRRLVLSLLAVAVLAAGTVATVRSGVLESRLFRSSVEVAGQVFIVTKGGENFKLGLVPIRVLDPEMARSWAATTDRQLTADRDASSDASELREVLSVRYLADQLPTASTVATANTDADGRFTVSAKKGDVLIAHGQRAVLDRTEEYFWVIRLKNSGELLVSNDKLQTSPATALNELLHR